MSDLRFPEGFLWGAATSAFQIEGGAQADGRGESIWDRFASTPGRIADGSNAIVACDHYHRWREDVAHLRWLGAGAYRFSIAWPRILPDGLGAVNSAGLDFYDALVDALLEAGIRPFATLYHWDLPQALQDRGGWADRDTADAFVRYADLVTQRLGDRVRHWATHNEPWCIAFEGHETGTQAPGHRDPAESLAVAHHVLLSHGRAVDVVRRNSPGAEVGIVQIVAPIQPATDRPADHDAAREADGRMNRWYLDPVFHARYPEDAVADRVRRGHLPAGRLPFVRDGDLETIARPIDFLGVNYYSRVVVRADEPGPPAAVRVAPPERTTDMGWEVFPQGLHDALARIARDYRPAKIYITENGAAYTDPAGLDGAIEDERRIEYLRGHLDAARRAVAGGVPLAGYFVWSLLDNFEWAHGYEKRFGLFDVDFTTLRRRPRASAHWYRRVLAANALPGAEPEPLLRRMT
ncbi:MAG TPA: GH1 family beta-glucosidase [Candidatus Eisenbacteria bacterium]|nr:GH1 family beta-glucosidase [Candidatus Eisenbacteria bacterium]